MESQRGSGSKKANAIVILIPYFGKFPVWFDLYLLSCSKQENIDFVFFTDCEIPTQIYPNTFFERMSFASYCEKVSDMLKLKFAPLSPYKLCDLKPFLGIIHADVVSDYEFWGCADIDLVYGDLSIVTNRGNLNKYDIVTTHTNRVAGHFVIVRRGTSYDRSCLKIKDWKQKLMSDLHLSVDEDDWVFVIYPQVRWLRRLYRYVFAPLGVPMKYCFEGFLNKLFCNRITRRCFSDYSTTPLPQKGERWVYEMKTSEMRSPSGKRLPYLHFLFFKKTQYKETDSFWKDDSWKMPVSLNHLSRVEFSNDRVIFY